MDGTEDDELFSDFIRPDTVSSSSSGTDDNDEKVEMDNNIGIYDGALFS